MPWPGKGILCTMTCHACGKPVETGGRFCPHCGAGQGAAPLPSLLPVSPVPKPWLQRPASATALSQDTASPTPTAPHASSGPAKLPPLAQTPQGKKEKNLLPWILLGGLGLMWGLMFVSNLLVKKRVEPDVLKLPRSKLPCLKSVISLDSAVDFQFRLTHKMATASELKKDRAFEMASRDCPQLKVKDVKEGVLIEAVFKDQTPVCRIWAEPGKKVDSDC